MNNNNEYGQKRKTLELRGIIFYFLCKLPDEDTFNKLCILKWEAKGISLNSYQDLRSKYMFPLFNCDSIVWHVLQYVTWNIVGSTCFIPQGQNMSFLFKFLICCLQGVCLNWSQWKMVFQLCSVGFNPRLTILCMHVMKALCSKLVTWS